VHKGDFFELFMHGFQYFRDAMTDTDNAGAARTIDVTFAVGVPDVNAFGPVGHGIGFPEVSIKDVLAGFHGDFLWPHFFRFLWGSSLLRPHPSALCEGAYKIVIAAGRSLSVN
jgi:hypothetical protein